MLGVGTRPAPRTSRVAPPMTSASLSSTPGPDVSTESDASASPWDLMFPSSRRSRRSKRVPSVGCFRKTDRNQVVMTALPKTRLKLTSNWAVKVRPGKSKEKRVAPALSKIRLRLTSKLGPEVPVHKTPGVAQAPPEADVQLGPADVQLSPAVPKTPGVVQAPRFHNFGCRKHSEP